MNLADASTLVLQTLSQACSQDHNILKPAEMQLKEWEVHPGFYTTLFSIFSNNNVDINVRWLAVLYFKNGIEKYWRKNAPNAISEEEKTSLRQCLLNPGNFNEPMTQLATQLAVLIAKVARLDCPRSWTELIPTLLEAVKSPQELYQQRILLTLYHVTKALASKRLPNDRKLFEGLTANIFSYLLNLWDSFTETFVQSLDSQDTAVILNKAEACHLCLKILRQMIVHGVKQPKNNADCITFLNNSIQRTILVLECKKRLLNEPKLLEKREKLVLLLTKVLYDVQENHPDSFIACIQPCLEITVKYNFTVAGEGLIFERFTVNCFNIMKNIMRCENYKPAIDETSDSLTMVAYKAKMEFLTSDTLGEICRRLISQYFLLTSDDLSLWHADPEGFVNDEGGDSWRYSLRPCTEVLFLSIIKEFREIITPVLLDLIKEIPYCTSQDELQQILKKDSIYYVVGLASFDLYDDIDFDQWFTETLCGEFSVTNSNYRIIRRRVIWLVGQWIGVKFSAELRPVLYTALLELLHSKEDLVVRLEASTTLKAAVDDMDFSSDQFMPFLEAIFNLLFELLKEVQECETKMHILSVMSFVIERVGPHIRPYAPALIHYLPMLWDESADHKLLRCAILSTLLYLVQGLGAECIYMYKFLVPIILHSTDVTQEPHVYLAEDALELWMATLHNSPEITDQLLELFKNMPKLLELGTEMMRTCLKIIESYILLGGKQFLQLYAVDFSQSIASLLTDLRTEGVILVMKVIELLVRAFPMEGPQTVVSILPNILKGTLEGDEYPVLMALQLTILSRIIFQNAFFFVEFIDHFSSTIGSQTDHVWMSLLDVYIDRIDNITQPDRRKMVAMALASLLPSKMSAVLNKFAGIINICVEVLHDVINGEDGECLDILVMHEEAKSEPDELETEHDRRKRQLSSQDPLHNISLKDYIKAQLTHCQHVYGQTGIDQLMSTVDPDIRKQLHTFMK